MALRDIQMPCNLKYKLMWKEIQKRCGEKYKWIWREIQMDVDLLISRRPMGDGWLLLPPTKQTRKEKSFAASFQNNSQANSKKLDIYDA